MKRRSLVFTAPQQVEIVEEDLSPPEEGQVLAEALVSAISPGTERLIFKGLAPRELPADESLASLNGDLSFPLRYGYSMVARVRALGPGVAKDWLDQLVFAFHPHTSAFTMPTSDLLRLPPGFSIEDAAFLPNMETAVNLLQDGAPRLGERVVVIGQGIIGLLTTSLLSKTAALQVITLEPIEVRRSLSLQAGASRSLDPGERDDLETLDHLLQIGTTTGGADLVYELSGNPQALNRALRISGYAGRVLIGSWYGTKRALDLDLGAAFHRQRLTLKSSQVSTIDPHLSGRWSKSRRIDLAMMLLQEITPSRWVTHRFELHQAQQAYEQLEDLSAIQILFRYSPEGSPS